MSTINFSAAELGNVARACVGNVLNPYQQRLWASTLQSLEVISGANARAYSDRYQGESGWACSAAEIAQEAPSVVTVDREAACRTVSLLAYNLDDHLGDEGVSRALVDVQLGALRVAMNKAGW